MNVPPVFRLRLDVPVSAALMFPEVVFRVTVDAFNVAEPVTRSMPFGAVMVALLPNKAIDEGAYTPLPLAFAVMFSAPPAAVRLPVANEPELSVNPAPAVRMPVVTLLVPLPPKFSCWSANTLPVFSVEPATVMLKPDMLLDDKVPDPASTFTASE